MDKFESISRAQESLRELELAGSLAKRLGILLDTEHQAATEKVNAMTLWVRVSSLPNEILSEILVLATRPLCIPLYVDDVAVEMQALREARSLSHVCRRFRSLVLDTPRIWNIISEHMMDTSQVRACIKRSKQMPMDILLEHYGLHQRGRECFSTFFRSCLLSSNHWRSLKIGKFFYSYVDRHQPHQMWEEIGDNMLSIGRLSGQLALPNLKRLIIHFNQITNTEHWETKFHPYWQWSMPSLAELRLTGCHPPPAGVSFIDSLRSFSILFELGGGQVYEMAQLGIFLSSCKVLEKVSLRFANWNSATPYLLHRGAATVQDAEFTFHNCTPAAGMAMCKSFQFPEASKLSVALWSFDEEESENQESREKQEALIREFLLRHPLTRTFSLEYHPGELRFVPIELPILLFPAFAEAGPVF